MNKSVCERCCSLEEYFFIKEGGSVRMKWVSVQGNGIHFHDCVLRIKEGGAGELKMPCMEYGSKRRMNRTDRIFKSLEPSMDCPYYCEHMVLEETKGDLLDESEVLL